MKQPHCHVIAHASSRVVDDCFESLSRHGWQFTKFDAIDGYNITQADWERIGVAMNDQGKMPRRPGAQGCWHSHWILWNLCADSNQPVAIMEHDTVVNDKWPDDLNISDCVVKLFNTAECKVNPAFGRWSKGAHAYTLTPEQARRLIDHARQYGAQAVDKHLGDLVVPWTFYRWDLVTLNPQRGPSSTSSIKRH
jgi:GR25 family glycosyltransferase involved in LPS biosynthesis